MSYQIIVIKPVEHNLCSLVMITWRMKLGGNLPPARNALLISVSGDLYASFRTKSERCIYGTSEIKWNVATSGSALIQETGDHQKIIITGGKLRPQELTTGHFKTAALLDCWFCSHTPSDMPQHDLSDNWYPADLQQLLGCSRGMMWMFIDDEPHQHEGLRNASHSDPPRLLRDTGSRHLSQPALNLLR